MALISCPGCGEQISDKSKRCIHCGFVLEESPKMKCPECGAELQEDIAICPNCGCPIKDGGPTSSKEEPQKVEVTKVTIQPKIRKKWIVMTAAILAIIIGCAFGIKAYQKQKAIEEAAQLSEEYESNMKTLIYLMASGASDSEECGNLIKNVWYNSIYEKKDSETDKYTRKNSGNGVFYDDFNDALTLLFSDSDFVTTINGIKENQDSVTSQMKEMQNPPDEWASAYDEMQSLYDAYLSFTNIVVNPSGSYQTFSENFNNADTDVANSLSKLKIYLEL